MGSFSADWLALREPADHAARSERLTEAVVAAIGSDPAPRILDLAAGTGSNLRYLSGHFPGARWRLIDHDPDLLDRVGQLPGVETCCLDLSSLDHPEIFEGCRLVTASALLDLVSERWLRGLAASCAQDGAAALFALSYDGRIVCTPEDPDDGIVVALVNEHQRTDKGFGPALGPEATDVAERCFAAIGLTVQRAPSDWVLTPESGALQGQLIDGWAQAASAISPERARLIDRWRERRLAHVAAGWSAITVGHEDMAAISGSEDLRI
jgi:hypothetical protein